jgi:hypothetical protein
VVGSPISKVICTLISPFARVMKTRFGVVLTELYANHLHQASSPADKSRGCIQIHPMLGSLKVSVQIARTPRRTQR